MDAIVFAAGHGTRLRPHTDQRPKALVEVGGRTLLEHVAARLVAAGATRLVVTACAFAEQIAAFVAAHDLGAETRLSLEPGGPYETGGGLLAARAHLRGDRPVLLHNVDVLSDLPLRALVAGHVARGALATLAVMERASSRQLLFDAQGLLGRTDDAQGLELRARPSTGPVERLAFAGVHVLDPALPGRLTERGTFPILVPYLRLAGEGARLLPYRVDGCAWIDVGRPADLERARSGFATS